MTSLELELDGLRRRYGAVTALDGLTFGVPAGEVFGFLGPNGAGKTTTMRAIFGVTPLDGGTIRWQGQPVDEAARRAFGYMPEERGLYPAMELADQVEYFATLHGMDARAAGTAAARRGMAEPFSGIDRAVIDDMSEVLAERAAAGVTVLFSSHQLDLVEGLCEAVAVVCRGRPGVAGAVA